jgi:hypothetical protein
MAQERKRRRFTAEYEAEAVKRLEVSLRRWRGRVRKVGHAAPAICS